MNVQNYCRPWIVAVISYMTIFTCFAGDWMQFRGNDASGTSSDNAPLVWSKTENVLWKCDVGVGLSSPIVYGDRVFVTSMLQLSTTNKQTSSTVNPYCKFSNDPHARYLSCIDRRTGILMWKKELHRSVPTQPSHPKNGYASETPITDGERVYAYFGNVGIFCLDFSGNVLWSYPVKSSRVRWDWGRASSCTIIGTKLILVNDNEEQSYIVMIDGKTGQLIWSHYRDEKVGGWSTPIVWKNSIRTEIIVPMSFNGDGIKSRIRSYDENGVEIWNFMYKLSPSMVAQPIVNGDVVYFHSGHNSQSYRPMFAIKAGARGTMTTNSSFLLWLNNEKAVYVPTPVIYKNKMYCIYDYGGKISCFDTGTGKELFTNKFRGDITASPLVYNNHVVFFNDNGQALVMTLDGNIVRTNSMVNERTLATPAIASGNLFIRGYNMLYCIGGK